MEFPFEATEIVLSVLDKIGRTEDLSFSPNNLRLAIASYGFNKIVIFDLDINIDTNIESILVTDCCEIISPELNHPHGIAWLDNQTIIVSNRFGGAVVFELPLINPLHKVIVLPALQNINANDIDKEQSTDCIDVYPLGSGLHEVLICSNNRNCISHHILDENDRFSLKASSVLLKKDLNIPDGVKFSPDMRWIAVSNHDDHTVFLFDNLLPLNINSTPCGILRGVNYPHGISFSSDLHTIFIADAGAPFVYGYYSESGNWNGEYMPFTKLKAVSDELFIRDHVNEQEGGIKGISFIHGTDILAITCNARPLVFFDLKLILSPFKDKMIKQDSQYNELGRPIQSLLRILNNTKIHHNEFIELIENKNTALLEFEKMKIHNLLMSHSWRITSPFRTVKKFLEQFIFNNFMK